MRQSRSALVIASTSTDHPLAVQALQRRGDDAGATVELGVVSPRDGVRDRDLAPGRTFAAAQQQPPVLRPRGLPIHRVHEVAPAHGAEFEPSFRLRPLRPSRQTSDREEMREHTPRHSSMASRIGGARIARIG
jgi:hypothetical protein